MNLIWEEMKREKSFLFDVGQCVTCLATLVWKTAGSPAGMYSGGVGEWMLGLQDENHEKLNFQI